MKQVNHTFRVFWDSARTAPSPAFLFLGAVVIASCSSGTRTAAAEPVDYLKQIKPLFAERCLACHGVLKQKAGLRLDTAALAIKGGKHGAAVKPGDADNSLLLERVMSASKSERMPPEGQGEPLTAAQIAALRQWIEQRAPAPADELPEKDPAEHWSFRPRVRPAVPAVANTLWLRNPIDAFIAKQHEGRGLTPQIEAPREVLIRRLYLDLVGMPPNAEEARRIDRDRTEGWYERLTDQLLADPRHGERWGRHWMDIWRYSDGWGLGGEVASSQKHIWHWRDWIVESVNADVPYDEMVRQMLAADELYPDDLNKLRATGFLARNFLLYNRLQWMDETVEHVSKAFLGLTMNCTKCHDHKFDPFPQADYYRLRAFFEPYQVRHDLVPGETDLARDGVPRVFDGLPDAPTYLLVRGQDDQPDKSTVIKPGVPAILAFKEPAIQPVQLPVEAWQPERRAWVLDAYVTKVRKAVAAAEADVARVKEEHIQKPPATQAQRDGQLQVAELSLALAQAELQSVVARGAALRAESSDLDAAAKRARMEEAIRAERDSALARARHLVAAVELRLLQTPTDKRPPVEKELTQARAALTETQKIAAGSVAPTDQFTPFVGARWCATRFVKSRSDDPTVKFLPQSTGRRKALAGWITDKTNPLTARVAVNHLWTRHMGQALVPTVFDFGRKGTPPVNPELVDWLASELVEHDWSMKHIHRLLVTSATYRMSSSNAGREANVARDADNLYWWRRVPIRLESQAVRDSILALAGTLDLTPGGPPVSADKDSTRRSLYFLHSNNERNLFLRMFDEAEVKECYRREQTVVPQQALALANSRLVHDAARRISENLSASQPDDATFIRRAFGCVLGIAPTEAEVVACGQALTEWRKLSDGASARANLIWTLFNHNDFVTLR